MLTLHDLDHLPDSVSDLAEHLGVDSALRIVATLGGCTIHVPKTISEGHFLHFELGREIAQALAREYGNSKLEIPRCAVALRDVRDKAILRRWSEGATANALALEFKLTERHVRSIISAARAREDARHLRLPGVQHG